ncbi:MAG TPA: HD domain-containing phosphohydrolase, partial [Burkholderiales bacterium]|nr:HD domain-containing phosphohydrolase [Burkholderiales bacterium]
LIGKNHFDLYPDAEIEAILKRVVSTGDSYAAHEHCFRFPGESESGPTYWDWRAEPVKENGTVRGIVLTLLDVTQRKQDNEALRRLNRALRTLSSGNAALVHVENETELIREMCRILTGVGEYSAAWIGLVRDTGSHAIQPIACAGCGAKGLEVLQRHWSTTQPGQEVVHQALISGAAQISHDAEAARLPLAAPPGQPVNGIAALPLRHQGRVLGVLCIHLSPDVVFDRDESQLLQELADDLAWGISGLRTRAERDRIAHEHQHHEQLLRQSLEESIQAIAATVERRDPYTAGHKRRVAQLCDAIARELGLPDDRRHGLRLAAAIHDLGKIQVPSEILSKPGRLSTIELAMIRCHPQVGYEIVKDIRFPWPLAEMILQHHELLDGTGYPQGLKAAQILMESRILTVADIVEAMASHRPYRPARGIDAALAQIESQRGITLDADAVDACIRVLRGGTFAFDPV